MNNKKQEVHTKTRAQASGHHHQNLFLGKLWTSTFVFHSDSEKFFTISIKINILLPTRPYLHKHDQIYKTLFPN